MINKNKLLSFISKVGVCGREEKLIHEVCALCDSLSLEHKKDGFGNICVKIKGNGGENPKAFFAHLDTPGMYATDIDSDGLVHFGFVGSKPQDLIGAKVTSERGCTGIITSDDSIDIGSGKGGAKRRVTSTDTFALSEKPFISGEKIFAPYASERIGAFLLLCLLEEGLTPKNDIYFTFTVQHNHVLRGEGCAEFALDSEKSYFLTNGEYGKDGKGAAVIIKDSRLLCDVMLTREVEKTANDNKIKNYLVVSPETERGINTTSIAKTGTKCAGIGISRKNYGACECVSEKDIYALYNLIKAICEEE